METVLFFAYMGWAIYSGYKVVSGRSEWLDRRAPLNMVVKFALSVAVGYVVAAFYFIFLILQFLGIMSRI